MFTTSAKPRPWTSGWYERIKSIRVARVLFRFLLAVIITVAVISVKHLYTGHWTNTTYLLLTTSIMLSAYAAGFTGGIISIIITVYYILTYLPPTTTQPQRFFDYEIQIAFFIFQSLLLSWLIALLLRHNVTELRLRRWFETTLSSIGDGVIATDELGRVVFMNGVSQKLTKWKMKEVYGKPLADIFHIVHIDTRRRIVNPLKMVMGSGSGLAMSTNTSVFLTTRTGERLSIELSASPIRGSGSILGAILTFRDVTVKNEREMALQKANRQIKEIFESITDAFYSVDESWRVTYANKKAETLLRMNRRLFINTSLWDSFPHIKGTLVEKKYRQVIRTKRSTSFEYFAPRLNGWFRINVYPMKNGLAVYINDITKRKRAELMLQDRQQELVQKERQLQSIIDGTPGIVFVKDLKGRFITINKTLEGMLGVSKDEIRGKTDYDIISRDLADLYLENDRKVLESGQSFQVEEEAQMKDGHHVFIANKFPLFDAQGKIYAICGISTDITDRKMLEQKKDEFMSVASHELKTPLTSVKAYVQILERIMKNAGNAQANLIIGKTNLYINKLQSLISDLLDISKIQAGKMSMERETFDMHDLISQSVESVQLFSSYHRIRIASAIRQRITGDRQRLEQVIVNFLTNAIKYSPGKKDVLVSVKKTENDITVSVTDYGIGIPPHRQKDLFKRFYRVEDTARRFSGLGIGLFISAEIIKRHGGRIWVTSSPRKGSTFSFSLPLGQNNIVMS